MPNLELKFEVHDIGFKWKSMRRAELIGHRDKDGNHNRKFTKEHLDQACKTIQAWMKEYNAMIDKPEPVKQVLVPENKDRGLDVRISTPPIEMKKIKTGLKSVGKIGPPTLKKVMAPANKDREPIKECDIWACPGECKCHD